MTDFTMSDDDILRFTQSNRKKLVDDIVKEGMPVIDSDRSMLLTALADMDRTALGNKRIGAAEKIAESDRLVADTIIKLNSRFGNRNPFEGQEGSLLGSDVKQPELDKLPAANPVPGETDQGVSGLKYDEFIDYMEKE